ncbi:MAG: hypothetical protein L6R48_17245, partial [Planctomycetes bacterium]|nr:hypothetical protein [Planctomycetota bacterium]
MKLRELAAEHNLESELLLEVVGEDLKIRLPKGLDSELKDTEIARILASDGLETADGKPFTPIIAKEFEEKHKRSVAARKAASTRKRKIADEEEAKRRADEQRVGEERRKHGEELDRRRREDENRAAIEAEAAAARAADEARLAEDSRRVAEEELHRREEEARRMSAEFAAMREARMPQQPVAPAPAVQAPAPAAPAPAPAAKPAVPVESAPVAKAPPAAPVQTPAPVAEAVAPQPVTPPPAKPEPTAPPSAPLVATIESSSAPAAKAAAPAPAPAVVPETVIKATKGLGSKLANMAKQTHEKADHSIKAVAKPVEPAAGAPSGPAAELSPEDRRRLIQANIQRNLEMQKRVQAAKAAGKRPQGFRTIDRTKTPGGPGGPSRGPGGPGFGCVLGRPADGPWRIGCFRPCGGFRSPPATFRVLAGFMARL